MDHLKFEISNLKSSIGFGQGQGFAGWRGLIKTRAQALQRVLVLVTKPDEIRDDDHHRDDKQPDCGQGQPPDELREVEHGVIERATGGLGQNRLLLSGIGQFPAELQKDLRGVEFQEGGISAHKTANVNRGGKDTVIALLEGANMVAADFGPIRHLVNFQILRLARGAQLFADCWHDQEL